MASGESHGKMAIVAGGRPRHTGQPAANLASDVAMAVTWELIPGGLGSKSDRFWQ